MSAVYPLRERAWDWFVTVVIAAIFVGPPVVVVARILEGGPLYATRTVTVQKTQAVGILPDIAGLLALWMVAITVVAGIIWGPRL